MVLTSPRVRALGGAASGQAAVSPRGRAGASSPGDGEASSFVSMVIGTVGIFKSLSPEKRARVVQALTQQEAEAGTTIFRQGDAGDAFYLIESGEVAVTKDGVQVATLGPREYFGELALVGDDVRAATAAATESTVLLVMTKANFQSIILADDHVLDSVVGEMRDWDSAEPSPRPDVGASSFVSYIIGTIGILGTDQRRTEKQTGYAIASKAAGRCSVQDGPFRSASNQEDEGRCGQGRPAGSEAQSDRGEGSA